MADGPGGAAALLGVGFGIAISLTAWWTGAELADGGQASAQREATSARPTSDPHLQRMLDRREDGAPAPLPAGGLPSFEPAAGEPEPGWTGPSFGTVSFMLVLVATAGTASSLAGPRRRRFLVLAMILALPGVALGALTLALGSLFGRGPA